MRFSDLVRMLLVTPVGLWGLVFNSYWRSKDKDAMDFLKRTSPVGPPLWKWFLAQTLVVWLVLLTTWYSWGVGPASIVALATMGCANSLERNWAVLSRYKMARTVALISTLASAFPVIIGVCLFLFRLVEELPPEKAASPFVGYFWGKIILCGIFAALTPCLIYLSGRRLSRGWRTPLWDYQEPTDENPKEGKLPAGNYRMDWRGPDDFLEKRSV